MKKNIVRKGLVVGIIVLFLGMAFVPISYAMDIENNKLNSTLSNSDLVTIPITVQEAWDLLTDTDNGIQIPIDIRPDEQWSEGFIDTPYPENAVHYSLDDITGNLYEFIDEYESKEIIPYSTTYPGYTLMMLLYILLEYNYTGTIYLMMGGFTAWMEAGLPIRSNEIPPAPTIDGEYGVVIGKEFDYYFNAIDPDGDYLRYHINWGDGYTNLTDFYESDEMVTIGHTYENEGTFIITASVEDICGVIGPESSFVPHWKSKSINLFLSRYLELFPLLNLLFLRLLF